MIEHLPENLNKLNSILAPHFNDLIKANDKIKETLEEYADGKKLKGNEIVGWLGEIYGKLFLNGKLVSDKFEYDVVVGDELISIKARKGFNSGWNRTSSISKIEGAGCPTHLMFLQFKDDYSLFRVWKFPWVHLQKTGRFKRKKVRGNDFEWYVIINEREDENYLKFQAHPEVLNKGK
jgi:hypothetical protein